MVGIQINQSVKNMLAYLYANWMNLIISIAAIFAVNTSFGYWRSNTKKFSISWIAAIHVPVPIALGIRFLLLGWNLPLIPLFVVDFAAGQYFGGIIRNQLKKQNNIPLTSWLGKDIIKITVDKMRTDESE
jgi:hypothetical protein